MPLELSETDVSAEGTPSAAPGRFIGDTIEALDISADALEGGEAVDPFDLMDAFNPGIEGGQQAADALRDPGLFGAPDPGRFIVDPSMVPSNVFTLTEQNGNGNGDSKTLLYVGGGLIALGLVYFLATR